jgi:HEAT repeat protein
MLEKPFSTERFTALRQLEDLGPAAAPAVPALAEVLKSPDTAFHYAATDALAQIGAAAVPALLEATRDQDAGIRSRALDTLDKIGGSPTGGSRGVDKHREIDALAEAVLALVEAMKDRAAGVRQRAARVLKWIGPAAADAVPALVAALLTDQDIEVRQVAADALARIGLIGPAAAYAVPALGDAMKDRAESVRQTVARALAKNTRALADYTRAGTEVIPVLVEAFLKDGSTYVRWWAAEALVFIDRDSRVGPLAADALTEIGAGAVPALVEALGASLANLNIWAANILVRIGPDAAPALARAMADKSERVRQLAAGALKSIHQNS